MQRHRRFDVFLKSIAWVKERLPSIKVLVLGRGTHMKAVAVEPAQKLGLSEQVVFAGYRKDDYREALACIDFKVFLVPGSDGTCRAVREAMAMGKPVVAARRGMLPEIVEHGRTGLIVTDTPRELGEAILKLAINPGLRQAMGEEAKRKALREFRLDHQADRIIELYSSLLRC
jgi:glycosyltransferase involved in cell wall biosynthesis